MLGTNGTTLAGLEKEEVCAHQARFGPSGWRVSTHRSKATSSSSGPRSEAGPGGANLVRSSGPHTAELGVQAPLPGCGGVSALSCSPDPHASPSGRFWQEHFLLPHLILFPSGPHPPLSCGGAAGGSDCDSPLSGGLPDPAPGVSSLESRPVVFLPREGGVVCPSVLTLTLGSASVPFATWRPFLGATHGRSGREPLKTS